MAVEAVFVFLAPPPDSEGPFMFRKPFRFWLITLLLGPTCALALEIGEIQVQSSLNQLFDARITLPKLTPEDLAKVSVKLAPAPMYKEFGLDRTATLGKLVFSIEYNAEGEVYVRVVSTEPIREPSLGLLMEFRWPRGKTFREFTVFLDPVQRLAKRPNDRTKTVLDGAAQAPPTPVAAPASTVAAVAPTPTPPQAALPPPAPTTTVVPPTTAPPSEPALPTPVPALTVAASAATPPAPPTPPTAPLPSPVPALASPTLVAPVPDSPPVVASAPPVAMAAPTGALPPPVPVETTSVPGKGYKSGSLYGPVTPGERLAKIALKVRPDPNITQEQMAQALFKANPQAFAKGIDELKVGSTLRLPTLRQIAKFSGSVTARQLAEAEEAQTAALVQPVKPGPVESGVPQAFALAPPDVLEPMMAEAAPSLAALLESPKPGVEVADKRELSGLSPSAKRAAVTPTVGTFGRIAPPVLAPVSAMPLTYLAVAEVIGTAVRIPGSVIPAQIAPASIIADVSSKAKPGLTVSNGSAAKAIASVVSNKPVRISNTDSTNLLGVLEGRVGEFTPRLDSATSTSAIASPTAQPDKIGQGKEATYQGGEQYGPVGANERLWDIATKVRPDAEIGKDVMMRALFLANPQAFSGREIDNMKEGALLRVPTLEEIVKHTGSPAARELLERQAGSASAGEVKEGAVTNPGRQEDPKPVTQPTQASIPTASTPAPEVVSATVAVAVPPSTDTEKVEKPVKAEPVYKGGEQYGPVGANERLWDIATKVRPDAEIGKDVMMKALFLANPQAFSGREIDNMKEGALLRVPTLEEIVKHTGSPAARELLEKGKNEAAKPADSPAPVSDR